MTAARLTILNFQAGDDFENALDRHVEWGLRDLDLKESIYGKGIAELSAQETERAARAIESRNLAVYCLSTTLFDHDLSLGRSYFQEHSLGHLPNVITIAQRLRPTYVRLLAPQCEQLSANRARFAVEKTPWVIDLFRSAVDQINDAGFRCTIENETRSCVIGNPDEALELFAALDRQAAVDFTWDIQNMWQLGCFPSLKAYEALKPMIGYVHFKGGQSAIPGGPLAWRSSLSDASWPVAQIAKAVIRDGVSPVLCVNPSHGPSPDGTIADYAVSDLQFLRQIIEDSQ